MTRAVLTDEEIAEIEGMAAADTADRPALARTRLLLAEVRRLRALTCGGCVHGSAAPSDCPLRKATP